MTTSVSSSTTTTATSSVSYSQNRNEFDTDALVEAAVSAKLARADTLETKVTANETKIAAYEEMQTLLLAMQDSLQALRADPSSSGQEDDVFLNRTGYLTSGTSTSADTLLSVTVEDGTELGSHEIEIIQVAKAERLGGSSQSSRSDAADMAGSFTLGGTAFTVTADMSLDDIVDTINTETTNTGIKASVIKVSDTEYMMVLTATETNAEITLADTSGTVLQDLGLVDENGDKADILQAAQPAQVKIDGVTIERDTNEIDDAIDGITLTLYKAESGNTLTLEVDNSLSDIKTQVESLVETYNALRDFVLLNQTTASDGSADESAVLFGDSILRTVSTQLQEALTAAIDEASLASLGLSFDEQNYLEIDEDALDDALLNDLDTIQSLFSFQAATSSGNLSLLRHGDGPESADFTLDITVTDGAISAVSVGGDTSLFTVSGSRIIGAEGSLYEGLTFVFTGSASQSIDVSVSQGIADRMWQAVEEVADEYDGQLAEQITTLEDSNTDLEDRITTIEANAETYRSYLLDKYARIEAKLAEAQSVLDLLEALTNSEDN
ncbi:flagellar filament capping protein FliD [Magnetospirillum gryphiswaldense]|uniref:Flagellar hook-associated protein 2 n=1 Tax=Magnetospirillum gryphiswaldense TaxID=55518 RepID=A4U4K6_9PROT|nr:flagellar filament capping protein FliD [Magnetospirillum gryphiswaldense]AVM72640.1 Flagellar hook-associated protein 2 [Magnetospirillum gryphiswaldense MSR-1]AVM76543.1 Flagellar hook-associated protein 2 [Magnetospirillum gryphiswaldense]CAM77813.1 flagellar hook-associated protein 2 (FliD, filament cap protein) precursor [Magnetospirillum gryphiswaldense MSR-1]